MIKEKILQFVEFKGFKKEKFFADLGVTYGNFKGKSKNTPINSNTLEDLLAKFPELSAEWLLRDEGDMIRSFSIDQSGNDGQRFSINGNGNSHNSVSSNSNEELISILKQQLQEKDATIKHLLSIIDNK